jgi:hypothetical protein
VKNKTYKFLSLFFSCLLILSLASSTGSVVYASSQLELTNELIDGDYQEENAGQFTKGNSQIYRDGEEVASIDTDGEDVVINISDQDMLSILEESGIDVSELVPLMMVRASGVTRVVISGALSKGNIKIYLSKVTLQAIKLTSAAFNALRGIVAAYVGNYISAAHNALNVMLKLIKASQIKHGVVYTLASWKYKGSYNQ